MQPIKSRYAAPAALLLPGTLCKVLLCLEQQLTTRCMNGKSPQIRNSLQKTSLTCRPLCLGLSSVRIGQRPVMKANTLSDMSCMPCLQAKLHSILSSTCLLLPMAVACLECTICPKQLGAAKESECSVKTKGTAVKMASLSVMFKRIQRSS